MTTASELQEALDALSASTREMKLDRERREWVREQRDRLDRRKTPTADKDFEEPLAPVIRICDRRTG